MHADLDLAGAGDRLGDVREMQHVGRAITLEAQRLHQRLARSDHRPRADSTVERARATRPSARPARGAPPVEASLREQARRAEGRAFRRVAYDGLDRHRRKSVLGNGRRGDSDRRDPRRAQDRAPLGDRSCECHALPPGCP